jgi:hypothetical protein
MQIIPCWRYTMCRISNQEANRMKKRINRRKFLTTAGIILGAAAVTDLGT